ncbi:hypothetical protein ASG22_19965 [Chryseobacterium sp. Leaf405]|uniref:DUF6443 domain-containing protein n=1 Tax=Chryseobacterium sp. Leaf405 TaxID=1736367 RepID=UPI0006F29D36|nr:DUF6443 domain-containing protein [Chryseobacterium sp. Leaf405]KQT28480.1 hypothetical protein ASG22_19965 [Chryseobacterium sp. Leaf405]
MKKILLIGGLLMTFGQLAAQSFSPTGTKNYIYTKDCLDADCVKKAETVQYFDGLGRPKQIVGIKASPAQKDVVGHIEYDPDGRVSKSYLPVSQTGTQNGAIYENPLSNATDPEIYGSEKIYSKQILENLPLARVKEAYNVGNAWSDKPVKYTYNTNTSASEVKKYGISTGWAENRTDSQLIFSGAYYPVNSLMKTSVTDEDGNTSVEYKNGKGQVVLTRKNDGTHNLDTYYIYNEYNQLAFVIPPLASVLATIDETNRNSLCYQYRYDDFGRLAEKKLPGKGWEYLVYDKQDRVVLSQDAMLGTTTNNFGTKGWMFTKYDKFGRVVYTGFFSNTSTRSAMQTAINNMSANAGNNEERSTTPFTLNGMDVYYTKNAFPTGSMTVLSVNYYDTYPPLPSDVTIPTNVLGQDVLTQDAQNASVSTKTLPTASYVKNVENDSWTKSYSFYDKEGRSIAVYSMNHLGGYTKTETEIDFAGVTRRAVTKHKRIAADTEKTVTETFEYDSQNRLLAHKHQVDSNPVEILAQNVYNELSQLKNKKVGGTSANTPIQDINYAYNIRGWMTKINDPKNLNGKLFGYEIKYNNVEGLETPNLDFSDLKVKPKYNGNISEVDWRTNTTTGDNLRRYGYVYDGLNRLSAGFYQKDTNPSAKEYFEKMDYDLNGNISHLQRSADALQGAPAFRIDDLTYGYSGNRMTSVTDSSTGDYRGYPDVSGIPITYYEESGSMKSHKDKGILDITYNYLDLPNRVTFDKTYVPRLPIFTGDYNVNTQYLYRADGVKLRKVYTYGSGKANSEINDITEYLDGFQYQATDTGGKPSQSMPLKFIPTAEGYYNFENNQYIYSYTDHLGNVRLSYFKNANGSAEVLEENNYYPFGLKHEGYNPTQGNLSYQYKYNGKELQTETGMLDYGWRQYMPELGRWNGMDQLSEDYDSFSPYAYVMNSPMMFTDPNGMLSQSVMDQIASSPHGTTWYNTGSGFTSNWGNSMDFDGNSINWSSGYTNGLLAGAGAGPATQYNGATGGFGIYNNILWSWTNPTSTFQGGSANMLKLQTEISLNSNVGLTASLSNNMVGKEVLEAKTSFLGRLWATGQPRTWSGNGITYNVNADGRITGVTPYQGDVPLGPAGNGKNIIKLLSKENLKSINTYKGLIIEHKQKLIKYIINPDKYDNLGILKNAPSELVRNKIIQSRINHLEHEIRTFHSNIIKILNGK